jgi:hypothetical protein
VKSAGRAVGLEGSVTCCLSRVGGVGQGADALWRQVKHGPRCRARKARDLVSLSPRRVGAVGQGADTLWRQVKDTLYPPPSSLTSVLTSDDTREAHSFLESDEFSPSYLALAFR